MENSANEHPQSATIVTGGGRGIGRAIVHRLAQNRRPVVVVGRTAADLESIAEDCRQAGDLVVPCVGDIADPATATVVMDLVRSRGWIVQHLVCNAGMGKTGPTHEFDPQLWRRIFDVNVHGCFHMVQACLPDLIAQGRGAISIISSLAGVTGVAYDAAYSASKHALVGFARSLALEYNKKGLTVAALCPSFIESDMTARTITSVMRRHNLSEADARLRIANRCPAQRILPAEEIAEAVALVGAGDFAAAVQIAAQGGYPIIGSEPDPVLLRS